MPYIGFLEHKAVGWAPVDGLDNVSPYYDVEASADCPATVMPSAGSSFLLIEADLEDRRAVEAAFEIHKSRTLRPRRGALLD